MAVEAVRSLRQHNKAHRLAYFYCTSRDTSGQDITTLLRLLLVQLCRPSAVPEPVKDLYDACNDGFPPKIPDFEELLETLLEVLKLRSPTEQGVPEPQTFLLIDGLDEFPWEHRDPLFRALQEIALAGHQFSHLRILVTSRNQPDIQDALANPIYWPPVPVESGMVQADIRIYVERTIQSHARLSRLPPEVKDAIRIRVVDEGRGM